MFLLFLYAHVGGDAGGGRLGEWGTPAMTLLIFPTHFLIHSPSSHVLSLPSLFLLRRSSSLNPSLILVPRHFLNLTLFPLLLHYFSSLPRSASLIDTPPPLRPLSTHDLISMSVLLSPFLGPRFHAPPPPSPHRYLGVCVLPSSSPPPPPPP